MYNTREDVENWLIEMEIKNYVIYEDLTVDVNESVNISFKKLKEIPIRFSIVNGNFNCSNNNLTNSIGFPEVIKGNFNCYYNQLTSLEGFLKEVTGNFSCNNNELTSLFGCPQEIHGDFDCGKNKLINLEYCPKIVKKDFYCYSNNLTSLEYCPKKISGNFSCSENKLTSLEYFPKEVTCQWIYLEANNIKEEELINFNFEIKNIKEICSDFNKDGDKEEFLEKVNHYKNIKRESELLTELSFNSNNIKSNKKL